MGFKEEMAQHDDSYEQTEAAPDTGGRLPDGTHQVQITEFRVEENDHGYALVVRFANERGAIRKWYGLPPTEAQEAYYKKDFLKYGFTGRLSELEEFCETEAILGHMAEVFIKTKPGDDRDYTNVYLNDVFDEKRAVGEGGYSAPPAGSSADQDDDIPF